MQANLNLRKQIEIMKSYDMYIFDLDDTLIHTFKTATKRYYPRFAEILGVCYPGNEVVRQHWGEKLFTSLERIFGVSVDQNKAIETLQLLNKESPVEPIDGVHRILDILRKHKKFIGLYSSSHPSLMNLCIHNSLSCKKEDFDFIFSTVEQKIEKPSPHIVFIMMDKYRHVFGNDIQLDKVLLVGDSVADYITAKNASVNFAAVLTGPVGRKEFLNAGLDSKCIFPSVKEVLIPPSDHGVVAIIENKYKEFLLIEESRTANPYYDHWSGPHGRCNDEDILEEETVVRETYEECGIEVKPVRKLYTCKADTKVNTVSFWEAKLVDPQNVKFNASNREVSAIDWFSLKDILSNISLYPGTKEFFNHYVKVGWNKHGQEN